MLRIKPEPGIGPTNYIVVTVYVDVNGTLVLAPDSKHPKRTDACNARDKIKAHGVNIGAIVVQETEALALGILQEDEI
jgi:hypothetical protein